MPKYLITPLSQSMRRSGLGSDGFLRKTEQIRFAGNRWSMGYEQLWMLKSYLDSPPESEGVARGSQAG